MANRSVSTNTARWLPLAAALVVASALPAAAQEPTGMQKLFGALGLIQLPPEEEINYRERAPLVVPPSPALIQPRSADDIARNNPDWPVDHDRRSKKVDAEAQKQADEEFYSTMPLGPDKLSRNRMSKQDWARRDSAARKSDADTAGQQLSEGRERLGPDGLGFKGWGSKQEEKVVFAGEPQRQLLTEPPPGLRTPSPNAPYGIVSKSGPKKTITDRSASPDDPALNK